MTRLILSVILVLLALPAVPATADDQGAVRAFLMQQQALERQARDQLIAANGVALVDDLHSPVMGNAKGDIWIVEFFDYACPYCKAAEPRLQALAKKDGHLKLVMKEFPILTPASLTASRAGLAANAQGKYAAFHNALMTRTGPFDDAAVLATAKAAGLDMARLKQDMAGPAVNDEIIATFNLARALRIFQTPGFIVYGHMTGSESASIDFPALVAAARREKAQNR